MSDGGSVMSDTEIVMRDGVTVMSDEHVENCESGSLQNKC